MYYETLVAVEYVTVAVHSAL